MELYDDFDIKYTSHAYIFLGDKEDITKRAIFLAKRVNCKNEESPCGYCESCRKIQNKTFPDLYEIVPQGASIKIDQVRELIMSFTKKPIEAKKKVYIIHEAQKMTIQAQNAILKSLEEPETQSITILLADNLKQLLKTVVSRCQVFDFSMSKSDGSAIVIETRQMIADILSDLISKKDFFDISGALKQISSIEERPELILEFISSLFRDGLAVKTGSKISIENADFEDIINKIAKTYSIKSMILILDIILKQIKFAKSKGNSSLIWFNTLIELREVI
ncbi:MAG TPA: hypothetical protein GX534_09005 [Thermoanaerobacterales bacterium]|nr:hypothetical protein [Thermoanaerobacterales bacterium]